MLRSLPLLALTGVVAMVGPAWAEKAPLSPEELRKTATHIVVGEVTAIYTRTEKTEKWNYTYYVAEIRVAGTEKGEGLKKGDLVYARYWHRAWVSKDDPEPSSSGHTGIPKRGDNLRVYMARNAYDGFIMENKDGGFNVIGANGFEPLKPAGK